jgi:hypothetical protein
MCPDQQLDQSRIGLHRGERHATPGGMHAQTTLDGQRIMMGQGSRAASGCQVRARLAGGGGSQERTRLWRPNSLPAGKIQGILFV